MRGVFLNNGETVQPAEKPRLLSKYFFLIMAVSLCTGLTLHFFNSTTSLYVSSLGGTASYTGLLLTLFTMAAIAARLITGRMVDVKGRRMVILAGLLIYALASLSFSFFPTLQALIFLRTLQGVGYSVCTTSIAVAITDVIPRQRMGEGIGYFGLSQSLSSAAGPGIAMALIAGGNFNRVFYAAAAILMVGFGLMAIFNYEKKVRASHLEKPVERTAEKKENLLAVLFEKTAVPVMTISLFAAISSSATLTFLMLYAAKAEIAGAGLFFTLSAVSMVVARLFTGKISDRFGPLYSLIPGFLLSIVAFILMLLSAKIPVLFFIAGVLYGLGNGITGPVLNAAVIKRAPDNRRGAASATFMMSHDIGFGIGGMIWGAIIDFAGFPAMFIGCALFIVISVVISVIVLQPKPQLPAVVVETKKSDI